MTKKQKFLRVSVTVAALLVMTALIAALLQPVLRFLVFLIPGSPKDILSYAAGLTRIKLSTWVVINLFGRIPGILLSTLGGDRLLSGNYLLTAALSLACGAVYVLAMPVCNRYLEKRKNEP